MAFFGWLLDPHRQFVWTKITTGVFTFLIIIIVSSFTAYWPAISWSNFFIIFDWIVIFFILTQTVTTRQRFFILLLIFLIASFKLSFFGARTWAMRGFSFTRWGLMGPKGYFENSGELSIQMLVFAPIALFFTIGLKDHLKGWQIKLLYLMPITAAMTVLGASSRGSQLALALQVLSLVVMTKYRFRILISIVLIFLIGYQLLPSKEKVRFRDMGKDDTSIQRLLYWKHGWQMMKEHPSLGVGYFNFIPYYTRYYPQDLINRKEAQLPHNIFIQVGTDTGFTGLIIFCILIVGAFTSMFKVGKEARRYGDMLCYNLAKGMNLSLIGFVVAGQFVTVAYYPFFWIHLAFVNIICTYWKNENLLSKI